MILVFDLDDTLYDEITYVKSGLGQVAKYVAKNYPVGREEAYDIMLRELEANGRGKVFDILLKRVKVYTIASVRKCLSVYRLHEPDIRLNQDAIQCLQRYKTYNKYIVTDGNKIVQKNKVEVLGLFSTMNKVFITHQYGRQNAKPSPYCFNRIANMENTNAGNIIYIGDNPKKDFINIKKLGYKTVRIKQGMFSHLQLDTEHEAHATIHSLDQLTLNFIHQLND